jgi:transposase
MASHRTGGDGEHRNLLEERVLPSRKSGNSGSGRQRLPVKNVPGRKTDVSDSEWLAQLARYGLLRGSFIPPKDLRVLRLASRYRRKLTQAVAGEKNRLHKLLDDAGIKLGSVVSDIDGVCARQMVEGLIAGQTAAELSVLGRGKLKSSEEVLTAAMDGDLSPRHRLVLAMALPLP